MARWIADASKENCAQTFSNQALNTLFNYYTRQVRLLETSFLAEFSSSIIGGNVAVQPGVCRFIEESADVWINDPPYADAINYHELSEYFLAWYEKRVIELFPSWYADTKRALAVTGSDENFRKSMVDCYRNLAVHMPSEGMQMVIWGNILDRLPRGSGVVMAGINRAYQKSLRTSLPALGHRRLDCKSRIKVQVAGEA